VTEDGPVTPEIQQAGPDDGRRPAARDGALPPPPPPPQLPPLPPARTAEALPPAQGSVGAAPSATLAVDSPRTAETDSPSRAREIGSWVRWVVEFVVLVVAAFLLATGIKTFVVQPFYIPSGSMEPTLAIADRVLVNKFVYRFSTPKRGDVVVFVSPEAPTTDLIKRVIATGGQTVQVKDGYVSVDGVTLDEPYVSKERRDNYSSPTPTRVPAGYVWVMGDNRGNSSDSRVIGPQPVTSILGKAFAIYWPVQRIGGL